MSEQNGAGVVLKGEVKIVGFVLKFNDLSEIEVWCEAEETRGGLNVARSVEQRTIKGITIPGLVTLLRFQLACEGIAERTERRTPASPVPVLELRQVAEAAQKFRESVEPLPSNSGGDDFGSPEDAKPWPVEQYAALVAALDRLGNN